MKYELVEFDNGKYGVRRRSVFLGTQYADFALVGEWHSRKSKHFPDCQVSQEYIARSLFRRLVQKPPKVKRVLNP